MAHVITQACCNDAACTQVCPVDCIHPTPGEEGFGTAEMLYIDPGTCIDCGSCVIECPVDAIYQDEDLPDVFAEFKAINAEYYADQPPLGPVPHRSVAGVAPPEGLPSRVAVIGAGASGWYAVGELLDAGGIEVDVFDQLPTPWGLVRAGVAPDHLTTKGVTRTFAERARDPRVRVRLNVKIGKDLSIEELLEHYHAVVIASGASDSRRLGIPGEDLPGSYSATEVVGWYNGHPDFADRDIAVSGDRAVIVGNGNVALDIARLLAVDTQHLLTSDIAEHALDALRESTLREVVVVGRRSVAHAACTTSELLALGKAPGVSVDVGAEDLRLSDADAALLTESFGRRAKYDLFTTYAQTKTAAPRRITFRFMESPVEILGDERVEGIVLEHNTPEHSRVTLDASLVVRSVGYAGTRFPGLPFEPQRGTIPHEEGRVVTPETGEPVPGCYVTGWAKRGPTGGIGANKQCAHESVTQLLADLGAGPLPTRRPGTIDALLRERSVHVVDWDGWRSIDEHERASGQLQHRPRVKMVRRDELVVASLGPSEEEAQS